MKLDYDEISPLTGNECVIVEADEKSDAVSYMCMETGFTTTDNMKIGSDLVEKYELQITDLMRDSRYHDEARGLVWYPAFLNIPGIGMLYPIGSCKGSIYNR